ncbi:hypothetical protein A1O3_06070 [Capronia epimyces CBS 606.96]|uniref:SnoaL-like domain-containing protein n=1 Tax=Capronia epimyces CBS 606.96 TaxID=1182542 RepID=W9XNY2_9EURO|nr:uncharacterized protein A1O3_06070 [Capronia epimyces CBS 606.96]EXJ82257.1 hypothetical protein A1O3_06070 [Capronia epimyces CBS 606.96]
MDEQTFQAYFNLVNSGNIVAAAEKYYKPEIYLLDDGHHYDHARILQLIPLIQSQMKLTYHLVGYYSKTEGNALAAEVDVELVALVDVDRKPFADAGFPEAFVPLKKGERVLSHHFYKYTFEGKKFTSSIGYTKNEKASSLYR